VDVVDTLFKYDQKRIVLESEAQQPIRRINPGGHNAKLELVASDRTRWFVKYCRNDDGALHDICEREALACIVGKVTDVDTIPAYVVSRLLRPAESNNLPKDLIRDRCVLMPFLSGQTLRLRNPSAETVISRQIRRIASLLAATYWLGDEDRGVDDVMLVGDTLVFVDNGLTGPRRGSRLRGAHPRESVFGSREIAKRCYPGKPSFSMRLLRDMRIAPELIRDAQVIGRIESLADADIFEIVVAARMDRWVGEVLIRRRDVLRQDYESWLETAVQESKIG